MQFFNPLTIERQTTPEGHQGADVSIFVPFLGRWNPSGKEYTFLTGEIPQRKSTILQGLTKPNTFKKDAGACIQAPNTL